MFCTRQAKWTFNFGFLQTGEEYAASMQAFSDERLMSVGRYVAACHELISFWVKKAIMNKIFVALLLLVAVDCLVHACSPHCKYFKCPGDSEEDSEEDYGMSARNPWQPRSGKFALGGDWTQGHAWWRDKGYIVVMCYKKKLFLCVDV